MQTLELTPRLQAVADLVPQGAALADIGTDHGYLPAWLLLQGKISHAVAADLNAGPLSCAKDTAQRFSLTEQMEFCCCDGLAGITPTAVDTITIAGMGGVTIATILQEASWLKGGQHTLILQPMSTQFELRAWLHANGYTIAQETLVQEDEKLYGIMKVMIGQGKPMTLAELWVGQTSNVFPSSLQNILVQRTIQKLSYALEGVRQSENEESLAKRCALEEAISGLRQMERAWNV